MTDIELEQEQAPVQQPLGELLTQGRNALNISIEAMAAKLNLNVSQLNELEQDDYQNLGPEIFVKGYIKSYCKFLGLNEAELMVNFKSTAPAGPLHNMQSFSNRFEKETHDSRLMLVSYIIVAIVLGSTGLWWWQNKGGESEVTVTEVVESTTISSPAVTNVKITEPDATPPKLAMGTAVQPELAVTVTHADEEIKTDEQQPLQADETTETSEAQSKEVIETKAVSNRIVMRFSGDSWVEVIDATGEKVAFGIKKNRLCNDC